MEAVFLKIVNMSISASYIALAVMLLRVVLKNAPKWIRGVLWGFVGIRLVCPFSLESMLSLIPSKETLPPEIITSTTPQIQSGIPLMNSTINPIIGEALAPDVTASVNPMQIITAVGSYLWLMGIIAMLVYTLVSFLRVRKATLESIPVDGNIRTCDRVVSPFILGIIKPKIYIPSNLADKDREYVLAHERAHLKRLDHIAKPLGFAILSVYWFNPIMWLSYILMCRDIELACDEKVIRALGIDSKKAYSTALINCSAPKRSVAACPLAFGEVGVKKRITSVLNYKKPRVIALVIAVILCIVTAVCFLTDSPNQIEWHTDRYYNEIEFEGKTYRAEDMGETFRRINGLTDEDDMPYVISIRDGIDNAEHYRAIADFSDRFEVLDPAYFCPHREADGSVKWGEVSRPGSKWTNIYVDIEEYKTIYAEKSYDVDGDGANENVLVYSEPQMGACFVTIEVTKGDEVYSLTHGLLWFYHLDFMYTETGEVLMYTDTAKTANSESNKQHRYLITLDGGEVILERAETYNYDDETDIVSPESGIPNGASDTEYYTYTDSYGTATLGLVPEEKSFILFSADGNDIVGSYEEKDGLLTLTVRDFDEGYIFKRVDEGLEYLPLKSVCTIPYQYTYAGAHQYLPSAGKVLFTCNGADDT